VISYGYGESEERGGYARPLVIESFTYKPDGTARKEVTDTQKDEVTAEDRSAIDVNIHWEPVPAFGDYASIVRWNRDEQPAR